MPSNNYLGNVFMTEAMNIILILYKRTVKTFLQASINLDSVMGDLKPSCADIDNLNAIPGFHYKLWSLQTLLQNQQHLPISW